MKTLLSSAALAALLLPATAFAQVAPDPAPAQTTDDESAIVVTGIRSTVTPLRADQIGGSVTVLDTDALDQRQTRAVSDILRDVPGVAVSRIPGQTQVRLRGAEANHTLVLIDGIEVSDPYAGEFDFGTLIADDVARVEVLRGQQSSIYGSDAIGGVIHYITLTGREAPGVSARVEGGSFGTVNAAARIAGVSGTFDYALSGTLNTTDGTPNARGGTRNLGNDSGAVSFKSTWSPASNARLTAVARYARTQADFNDSDSNPASKTFGYTIDTPGAHFINEAVYGLLRGELDLLDGKWTQALTGQIADTTRNGYGATARTYGDTGQRLKGSY
ncbi:Vitamin B12 transporter BtuB [compost metagenome]